MFSSLAAIFLATACDVPGIGSERIGKITQEPARYVGHEVTVAGTVSKTVQLPFLPGIYWLSDGTGEIAVLATGTAPLSPSKVRLRARVENVAALGGVPLGLHLVEVRRR